MNKRFWSLILCVVLLVNIVPFSASAATMEAGGWNETIWAELPGVSAEQVTGVRWTGTREGALTGQDLTYLVRQVGDHTRIDIPGIPAGSYTLTVTTTGGTLKQSGITVEAQDRSGFAHFGYTAGVGAYNDDGSLKTNAIVLYVTEENKNTVTVTSKDGTTVTGIGNILNSVGMDVGGGRNAKGGKANTNQDILRKLAADGTPLVVRLLGKVTAPAGLTAYNSVDYGGSAGDNGFMARLSGGKDITIEGIGVGASIDGWGLHFICQTADYAKGWGKSFEVRNLTFRNVPEDCVGMEGQQDGASLTAPVERCWIHHCAFYAPKIANPAESDKDGGDGACDFKRGQYFTNSYCYYEGYHKTNLVGSGDDSLQYHLTYHHNYWKNCESRGPLARQADIHMYNNIFEGQSSYCMSLRANSYIFSEYNLFIRCKNVTDGRGGGVCKSFGNSFTACSGTDNGDLKIVTDKTTKVSSGNKYANFDTNSARSYIPGGRYQLQGSIPEMKAVVLSQSGPHKQTILKPEDVNISVIPTDRYPTEAVKLDYSKTFNKTNLPATNTTVDNIRFNVTKTGADHVTLGDAAGCDVVFYVDKTVHITVQQHASSANPVILCNAAGQTLLSGSGTAKDLPAGYYFLQSGTYDPGSGKYKEAKLVGLTIRASNPGEATDPIPTVPPTVPPTEGSGSDDATGGGTVTVPTEGHVHNFTEQGKNSDFYSISGNLSTAKGTVAYAGQQLTQCLKIESATVISFTAPAEGTLTLVFGGSTNAAGKSIKVDGEIQTIGNDHILTLPLAAGKHTITKGDSINLFYMIFAPVEQPPETTPTEPTVTEPELTEPVETEPVITEPVQTEPEGTEPVATEPEVTEPKPTLPPHRHSYISNVTKPAHCAEEGVRTYVCACGALYKEVIPATGIHEYAVQVTKPAGCLEDGVRTYRCDCGDTYHEPIPATGHRYGEWIVVSEATQAENGLRKKVCGHCADEATESIPKLPAPEHTHSYTVKINKEATCTEEGKKTFKCSCGAVRTEVIPMINHQFSMVVTKPTCGTHGSKAYTCSLCNYSYTVVLVATGDHSFAPKVIHPDGSVSVTCTVCGYTRTTQPQPTDPTPTEPEQTAPTDPTTPVETLPSTEPDATEDTNGATDSTGPAATVPGPTAPDLQPSEEPGLIWAWLPGVLFAAALPLILLRRKKKEE